MARRYITTIAEASFLRIEILPACTVTGFADIPYSDPEFLQAVTFLRNSEGIEFVQVFLAGRYVQVDLSRMPPPPD